MYAKEITKAYLEKLGITEVSADGKKIICKGKELNQLLGYDGYLRVNVYDPDVYKVLYPITKRNDAGTVVIPVHRLVYSWFKNSATAGFVVDHINDIKDDNRIENLQLLTPAENIWKGRPHNVRRIKCNANRPLSFYMNKLNKYLERYEAAKQAKQTDLVHKLRANISQTRARIRYWLDMNLDNIIHECFVNNISYEETQAYLAKLYEI